MLRKNKQLIIGFVLGALLFTIVPVNATVQEYLLKKSPDKFVVDGEEVINEKLPMLKYGGYNYIPAATFREICDKIGVGFEWVGEKKEIRIDTNIKKPIVEKEPFREREDSMENIEYIEKDGYELLVVDGIEYIALREIGMKHEGYDFLYDSATKKLSFVCYQKKSKPIGQYELLVDDIVKDAGIDLKILVGRTSIEYNDFKVKILPIINN